MLTDEEMEKIADKVFKKMQASQGKDTNISSPKNMTVKQLVDNYGAINDPNMRVVKALRQFMHNKRCIVVDCDGQILPDKTVERINCLKEGYPETEYITDNENGELYNVIPAGQKLNNRAPQNPLFPHRPLLPGKCCDLTGYSYKSVPSQVYNILCFAVQYTKELVVTGVSDAIDVQRTLNMHDLSEVKKRYPRATLKFTESKDRLPDFTIRLNAATTGSGAVNMRDGKVI